MTLRRTSVLVAILLLSACGSPTPGATVTSTVIPLTLTLPTPKRIFYVDAQLGSDSALGGFDHPWQTIKRAIQSAQAGDLIYIRSGEYSTILGGWSFTSSGNVSLPITISNYPGEQVVMRISKSNHDFMAFRCWSTSTDPLDWQTPKADFIHITATDVSPRTLSNGIISQKGIVIQGSPGEQAAGIEAAGCDNWEIAGVDFIDVGYGVFAKKRNFGSMQDSSSDHWYVHDNRVYRYYRESGMQFDGDNNRIQKNEIYKVSDEINSPAGCQLLNINGHGNTIGKNILSRLGSQANCGGILFEWDMSDENVVEQNHLYDVPWGIEFAGGDNNLVRNNVIHSVGSEAGLKIVSYDDRQEWPCDEPVLDQTSLPANNPADPDYRYYYEPRNCHSFGNRIYNNTIHGFDTAIQIYDLIGENTVIQNNGFSGWRLADICFYEKGGWQCHALPPTLTADHNAALGVFGFIDLKNFDFHLLAGSKLIDTGLNLGAANPNDFDGNLRPQGTGYDIGAYEYPSP